ncbi:MAG: ribosome maturation factor RimP [Pseudomonadota bacterium]
MEVTRQVADIIEPTVLDMGYELVRVQLTGGDRAVLQIMAERADREDMLVDDCADLSRAISALLDVADPIKGAYSLEVSSPGIDRPLTKLEHFARFAGFEARIELTKPLEDTRKRFRGTLAGVEDQSVLLTLEDDEDDTAVSLPFDSIAKAKLILTDALLAEAQR